MDDNEVDDSPVSEENPKQEVKREVFELVKLVLLFLVLFWGIKTFIVEGYEVQGPSMAPTLEDSERILVLKLPHELSRLPFLRSWSPIEEGDIVVFESHDDANKRYIKRVIAKGPTRTSNTVEADTVGDHVQSPYDVKVRFEKGKVYVNNRVLREEYLTPEEYRSPDYNVSTLGAGDYYVLGDHRSVSKDSRTFGPIDDNDIIGKAVFRFWPLNKFGPL